MQAYVIVSLFVAALAVVFAFQNNTPTVVHFFGARFEGSLALVIIVAAVAGGLATFLASVPTLLRMKWHLRNHRKRLAALEEGKAPAKGSSPGTPSPRA